VKCHRLHRPRHPGPYFGGLHTRAVKLDPLATPQPLTALGVPILAQQNEQSRSRPHLHEECKGLHGT
jgi:hypothetical protein